jgi:FemAB-related protein (PEP-CTERM system-associated)
MQRAYGHAGVYLWAREGAAVRGVLPAIFLPSRLFCRSLVSMPFLDEGGVCADEPAIASALVQEAACRARGLGADLDLRHRHPSGLDLEPYGSKVTFRLDLSPGASRLWAGLEGKVRNQVRKAEKSGSVVEWAGRDGVAEFYDVFAVNMRDLGSPVHGRPLFEALLDEFGSDARVALVRREGRTIAGAICLVFRDTLQVPWASSLRVFRPLCPSNLLYWEIMRWAAGAGLRWLDFGRSSRGSGTYHFKSQWGAVEEALHWQYLGRDGRRGGPVETTEASYGHAAAVWRRLPVSLTRVLGPAIRRQISN